MNIGLTIEHCTASHRNCFGQNRSFTSLSLRTSNPFFCWIPRLTMRSEAVSCFFICLCLLTLLPKRNEFPQIFLTNEKASSHFSQNCCQKQESTNPMFCQMSCQPYIVPNAVPILCFAKSYVAPNFSPNAVPILCCTNVPILCCAQCSFNPMFCAKSTQTFVCSGRRASAHVSEKQPGRVTTNNSLIFQFFLLFYDDEE